MLHIVSHIIHVCDTYSPHVHIYSMIISSLLIISLAAWLYPSLAGYSLWQSMLLATLDTCFGTMPGFSAIRPSSMVAGWWRRYKENSWRCMKSRIRSPYFPDLLRTSQFNKVIGFKEWSYSPDWGFFWWLSAGNSCRSILSDGNKHLFASQWLMAFNFPVEVFAVQVQFCTPPKKLVIM